MNFYKRHLGDIAKACAHLSQGEIGAYDLLLDWLYGNEKALPQDVRLLHRIGRAESRSERENVDRVIVEFFTLSPLGYVQKRAVEEIERAQQQAAINREIGKRGGRPKGSGKKPNENRIGFENETESKPNDNPSQTPDSRQTQELPPSVGASAPDPDPIFGAGLAFLVGKGVAERGARGFLGLMRKKCGDLLAAELLAAAEREDVSDPIPWLRKAYERRTGPPSGPTSKAGQAITKLEGMKRGHQQPDSEPHATLTLLGPGIDPGKRTDRRDG